MRQLIVTENISLDGVIEAGDWFSVGEGGNGDLVDAGRAAMAASDGVLLGRVTYEQFQSFWPKQVDDTTGVTDHLNRTMKYVVSSTLTNPTWEHTTVLRGPLAEEIRRITAEPGKDIVATGSMTLVEVLQRENLVDRYRLLVYPVVLGEGRRLFPNGVDRKLTLVETKRFESGIVQLEYQISR